MTGPVRTGIDVNKHWWSDIRFAEYKSGGKEGEDDDDDKKDEVEEKEEE
jgi:hypothetical protein